MDKDWWELSELRSLGLEDWGEGFEGERCVWGDGVKLFGLFMGKECDREWVE